MRTDPPFTYHQQVPLFPDEAADGKRWDWFIVLSVNGRLYRQPWPKGPQASTPYEAAMQCLTVVRQTLPCRAFVLEVQPRIKVN